MRCIQRGKCPSHNAARNLPTGHASSTSATRKRASKDQAEAVISELLRADQREHQVREEDDGNQRAEAVERFEADHGRSPSPVFSSFDAFIAPGPSSRFSPKAMAASAAHSASKAPIQTKSIHCSCSETKASSLGRGP